MITDCRSEIGVTVGLIDAIISVSRVLACRLSGSETLPVDVVDALNDLSDDEDLAYILKSAQCAKTTHEEDI